MFKQRCIQDAEDRSEEISGKGGPVETLVDAVNFELFRLILEKVTGRPRPDGRPDFSGLLTSSDFLYLECAIVVQSST